MRPLRLTISAVFLLSVAPSLASEAPKKPVDVAIVLAVDVSSSIAAYSTAEGFVDEYKLQTHGLVAALRDPETIAQIENCNPNGVALSYVQWSGGELGMEPAKTMVSWTVLRDREAVLAFAKDVERAPRFSRAMTDIVNAMFHARELFAELPVASMRKLVLMSSDGPYNVPRPNPNRLPVVHWLHEQRELMRQQRIELDALIISNEEEDLLKYFQENVITPDGMTSELKDFRDYGDHFKKLLQGRLCPFTS